jgi:energy coupling factor transporter S component ThiW
MDKNLQRITTMALLAAAGVASAYAGALPLFGARLFPAQGALNVIAGGLLGPLGAAGTALLTAILRNLLGTGTPLAIPGSVVGALLAGLMAQRFRGAWAPVLGEVVGTGIIGALLAYPLAVGLLGNKTAAAAGWTFFMVPFSLSSGAGALLGGLALAALRRASFGSLGTTKASGK